MLDVELEAIDVLAQVCDGRKRRGGKLPPRLYHRYQSVVIAVLYMVRREIRQRLKSGV